MAITAPLSACGRGAPASAAACYAIHWTSGAASFPDTINLLLDSATFARNVYHVADARAVGLSHTDSTRYVNPMTTLWWRFVAPDSVLAEETDGFIGTRVDGHLQPGGFSGIARPFSDVIDTAHVVPVYPYSAERIACR